jgi:hypothetical protein
MLIPARAVQIQEAVLKRQHRKKWKVGRKRPGRACEIAEMNALTPGVTPSGIRLSKEMTPRSIVLAAPRAGNNSDAVKKYRARRRMVPVSLH